MKTENKSNIVMIVSTAIFAVLSFSLMFTFKANEAFFDTHGRIGNLAQTEQDNIILETTKAASYKRNINVTINDQAGKAIVVPLEGGIALESVVVREEFANNKLVLTLKDAAEQISDNTEIITDSSIMEAVGLFRQEENVVLEIYEYEPLAYKILTDGDNCLKVEFVPVEEVYSYKAVIYVPFDEKDRLYSEDWVTVINTIAGEDGKIYLASAMRESYTMEQVSQFAEKIQADLVIGIDYKSTTDPESIMLIYNKDYFIPEFSSADLAIEAREIFEEKTGLGVAGFINANEENLLIKKAKVPACEAVIYVQTENESIEDKYTLNHSVMEAIASIIKNTRVEEIIE